MKNLLVKTGDNLIFPLLFLFFFTLHADQWHVVVGSYAFRLNNFIALFLFLIVLLNRKNEPLRINRQLALGTFFFFLSCVVSCLCSPYTSRCVVFVGWVLWTIFGYVFLPYLLIMQMHTERVLRAYFLAFVLVGLCACGQLFFSFLGFESVGASQKIADKLVRPNAFSYEPSFYVLYMTPFMVLVHCHYLLNKETFFPFFKKIRLQHVLLAYALVLVSTATSALFAIVSFGLILFVVLFFSSWRKSEGDSWKKVLRYYGFALVLFICVGLLFPGISKRYFFKFFTTSFWTHPSFYERGVGIYNSWKIFLEHPFLGVGLGGIPPYLFHAWLRGDSTYIFLSQQQQLMGYFTRELKLFEPTNMLTELLGSLGIVGAFAIFFLIASYASLVSKARKYLKDDVQLRRWILAFALSVWTMLLVGQFNQGLLRTYIWAHFAISFALTEKIMFPASRRESLLSQPLMADKKMLEVKT